MPESIAETLFAAEAQSLSESPPRRPGATYRLQLHKGLRLEDAAAIVPYLHDLGITDVYLSPYLDARPGSTHGYDVFDHSRINPEVGDDEAHDRLLDALQSRGMGRVLDVVPNHMGINGPNRYWLDVLEIGPASPYAGFFDIDWHPIKDELDGRVLLPILEDQYGTVLESGKLSIRREGGSFLLRYHEASLPLTPRSYATVLGQASREITERFDPEGPIVSEFLSLWASTINLPDRTSNRPEDIEHLLRERAVVRLRIERLCDDEPSVGEILDRAVDSFQGTPGDAPSFDSLHQLLEQQVYRLAFWRVASQEINYRRFFDINDLAGLRTEDSRVFDAIHALIFAWIARGGVTGLRIDHPDGLADPSGYFRRLQESAFVIRCRARFDAEGHDPYLWLDTAKALRRRFREAACDVNSPLHRPLPIVAEKILSRGEVLPEDWPIDGTVGYEYLNVLNGLFVNMDASDAIQDVYREFTGDREPFAEVLYQSKRLIARASLASEINALARQLNRVSEGDRATRDFTYLDLRQGIREVVAAFPVYRTYLQTGEPTSQRDRGIVEQAIARARKKAPSLEPSVFDFLRSVLVREDPEGLSARSKSLRDAFVRRFQQTTGPIQAKGLEDTAFYRQYPLASLNEVGADPVRFGNTPGTFHAMNADRLKSWPGTLSTTATHDTKRGEDARIRINVLSEIPDEWKARLARWCRANGRKKAVVNDAPAPDAREEYLLYQALIGSWPFDGPFDGPPAGFAERIIAYFTKAVREAKLNASWGEADASYVNALGSFAKEILEGADAAIFLKDFLPFQRRIARVGVVHSLAQSLLKIASPGVPDVYQGCEFWDFSLVDPDNRRPVDYEARRSSLERIRRSTRDASRLPSAVRALFDRPEDGAIKQYVVSTALRHRREHVSLYASGTYRPADAKGDHCGRIVAFGRFREGQGVLAVAPRLVASLMGDDATIAPVGPEVWKSTRLILPEGTTDPSWRDLFTGRVHPVQEIEGERSLPIGDLFRDVPVALLTTESP